MNEYAIVKTIHVISSTLLFGTGIGSAFYMFFASRARDPRTIAFVVRHVVIADAVFTATAVIVQPLSGLYLAHLAGFALTALWIWLSFALYLFAGACWLPVVWMQVRMRRMAQDAVAAGGPLPERYWKYFRAWVALGVPAFVSLAAVFWLMVAKPT